MFFTAKGEDQLSRIGLAISEDGEHFERFETPLLEGDELSVYERLGIVTPRITKIDREYVITYAALSVYSTNSAKLAKENTVPWRSRISIMTTRDFRKFERLGVVIKDLDTFNPVLFPAKIQGNYWLMHRLDKGVHVSVSPSIRSWGGGYQLFEPQEGWESGGISAASAPLETERGWLLLYNARDIKGVSRVGAVLLDRQNPAFIIARTKAPLLEAVESWEKTGTESRGIVLAGALLEAEELHLYYGAGGKVIGLGKISLDAVLQPLGLSATA